MRTKLYASISVILLSLFVTQVSAQGTFAQVYQLLQTHCAGSACHDGTTPTFNINLPQDSFYHSIINATPVNPAAAANYNKLVVPGDVQRSFLLRKLAHGISSGLALTQPAEGADMPSGLPAMKNFEIELVRQWILYGAADTGTIVDTALINTYYRTGGIDDSYYPHDPPPPGQGFQIYCGRFFIHPNTQTEIFCKYDLHLNTAVEAPRMTGFLGTVIHHFVMYEFMPGQDVLYRPGIRPIEEASMQSVTMGIGFGPNNWDYTLPQGTAYFLDQGQIVDLNLHTQNPSPDSILSTDMYFNVYTQPAPTAMQYMTMRSFLNDSISIPEDNQNHTFTSIACDSNQTKYWKLWKLYSHTHKYGTGFNIWLRNPDGSKGAIIYDGNYSYEQDFNVGYYRWGPHITIRTWPDDSLFQVDPRAGFIYEATYKNTAGPDPVNWGLTADEEMMVLTFQAIQGDDLPTALSTPALEENRTVKIYPNPVADEFVASYELTQPGNVRIDITDMLGKQVANLFNGMQPANGKYTRSFDVTKYKLAAGTYFVSFNIGGKVSTEKLVVTN